MKLSKNLSKLLVIFLLGVVIAVITGTFYAIVVIKRTPLHKISGLNQVESIDYDAGSTLDEGSIVKKEDFEAFLSMSMIEASTKDIVQKLKEDSVLEEHSKNHFGILKDFEFQKLYGNNCEHIYCFQRKIPFQKIPRAFWKGLIGIEDSRFLEHFGIDPKSILRALVKDIAAMKFVEGGSTITQQLVKNLFFTNERRLSRKIDEAIAAIYVNFKYSKEETLQAYFNEIDWGAMQGIRIKGIWAASAFYFQKPIEFLDPFEATILIALLKGPYYYHPIRRTERLKNRTHAVFKRLVKLGFFDEKESHAWNQKKWSSWVQRLKSLNETRPLFSYWHLLRDNPKGDLYEKFVLNRKAYEVLRAIPKEKRREHQIEAKLFIKELKNQKFENFYQYFSSPEKSKTKAFESEIHQLGSILKPLLYSLMLQSGKSLDDLVTTAPYTLNLKSGKWTPRESSKIPVEEVPLWVALQKSMNNPLIRTVDEIGFEQIETRLLDYIPELQRPLSEYPAQLLGAIELPLARVMEVYEKFIGNSCEENDQDEAIEVLTKLSDPKLTTIRNVTYRRFKDFSFFGKTGTSNYGNDNWFIAFEGERLYAFWVGSSGKKSTKSLKIYGSTTSFKIFQNYFMERGKNFPILKCVQDSEIESDDEGF
ncbi:MAG: transglycosylase domain-containing protein [Bacteriovoracaceae bacterium]